MKLNYKRKILGRTRKETSQCLIKCHYIRNELRSAGRSGNCLGFVLVVTFSVSTSDAPPYI